MKSFSLFLAVMLAGCASLPPVETSEMHPANPRAASGVYPPAKPALMNMTNVISTENAPVAPEHHHHE